MSDGVSVAQVGIVVTFVGLAFTGAARGRAHTAGLALVVVGLELMLVFGLWWPWPNWWTCALGVVVGPVVGLVVGSVTVDAKARRRGVEAPRRRRHR